MNATEKTGTWCVRMESRKEVSLATYTTEEAALSQYTAWKKRFPRRIITIEQKA